VYVDRRSVANATVTLSAPPETGAYRRFLVEHRYLAIIPTDTIDTLYEIHPWTPIIVIDSLLGIPFYLLSIMLIGGGRIRTRSRSRDSVSSLTRLLNRFS
jgi:signal peptidase